MFMMLGASEKKYAYFKSCKRFFTACLLLNSELYPGTVLIQASLLGELSADWFVFNVKRLYQKTICKEMCCKRGTYAVSFCNIS